MENTPLVTMEEHANAIMGICSRFGQDDVVAYDKDKVLANLEKDGMSRDDAIEHFEYNIIGAYVGDTTPCFIDTTDDALEVHGIERK